MSIHDGHRQRVRDRFLTSGLDEFNEHQVLEMLLFYCCPRKDTNVIAHKLIDEFGSLVDVLEAPVKELEKVPGVGKAGATLIAFASSFSRYYMVKRADAQGKSLRSIEECCEYLQPRFVGKVNETVYLLCLDAKCKVLCCKMLGEGSVNSASVPVRKLVETALAANATSVVLAHNHPGGVAIPSGEDVVTTRHISAALRAVDVILADHIVFADGDSVSMVQSGMYNSKTSYATIR